MKPLFTKPPNNQDESGNLLPGEMGNAWRLPSDEEGEVGVKEAVKKGWDDHAFNHYTCERISVHRSLPDRRDKQ